MGQTETLAKLAALHKAVPPLLENPKARYFDPAIVLDLFIRWSVVRDDLRAQFPSLLGDLPLREIPQSSGTSDYEARGYITRSAIRALTQDLNYAIDALSALSADPDLSVRITREGAFFAGQHFDAILKVSDLISHAHRDLMLIDGYVTQQTLAVLSEKAAGVSVRVLTYQVAPALKAAAQAFAKQYGPFELRRSRSFHDRFLIIDDAEFYHFGASIKDLGNKGFMFSRVEEPGVLAALRSNFSQEWKSAELVKWE